MQNKFVKKMDRLFINELHTIGTIDFIKATHENILKETISDAISEGYLKNEDIDLNRINFKSYPEGIYPDNYTYGLIIKINEIKENI